MRAVSFAAGPDLPVDELGRVLVVDRTCGQLARGMGLPLGPNVYATHQRYRNQIYRTVHYLTGMGLMAGAEEAPHGPDGRGTCILLRVPAGVAQSVRAALRYIARGLRRVKLPSWWTTVVTPPSGGTDLVVVQTDRTLCEQARAGARASVDATGPPGPTPAAAAPIVGTTPREGGATVGVAIRAWQAATKQPWKLPRAEAAQLQRYAELLDRDTYPGYAAHWLDCEISDAFEGYSGSRPVLGRPPWDRDGPRDGGRPRSLVFFVRLLRRHYRDRRRDGRRQAKRRKAAPDA